jgi:hypothetical protein
MPGMYNRRRPAHCNSFSGSSSTPLAYNLANFMRKPLPGMSWVAAIGDPGSGLVSQFEIFRLLTPGSRRVSGYGCTLVLPSHGLYGLP